MPAAHRNGDLRTCGASTVVSGQSTVFVNGRLWSVDGDPNSHGSGNLSAGGAGPVFIGGLMVIVNAPDTASADSLCIPQGPPHCAPDTAEGSGDVFSGG
jgi:hypothetical protein